MKNHVASMPDKWEVYIVWIAFIVYWFWQINAILHHGSWGQDFALHLSWIQIAENNPIEWVKTYNLHRTMYHFIASLIFRMTQHKHAIEIVAFMGLMANSFALYLLYRILKKMKITSLMRISCIIFLFFLPFAMIHAIVLAADSFATPIFIFLLYLFTLFISPQSKFKFCIIAAAISGLLVFALTIKFTFMSFIPAAVVIYVLFYRAGYLTMVRAMIGVITILLFPAMFGCLQWEYYQSKSDNSIGVARRLPNVIDSPYMNLRSLLMVKKIDLNLLAAPPFNFSADGKSYALLQNNKYSYPGLLHLGMFTDLLNFYQFDPHDGYFGPRELSAQTLMQVSVNSGLIFSIFTLCALPAMGFLCLIKIWQRTDDFWAYSAVIGILSGAFFLNIVFFFPYIPGVYWQGYWLPRLVVPALLSFFILAFAWGDRTIVARYRYMGWVFLIGVLFQSILHLSFLFPIGKSSSAIQVGEPRMSLYKGVLT